MKLTIIDPAKSREFEVAWIEAQTPDGSFVIQSGHAETTFILSKNKELIYCFKTGKQETVILEKGGILEVQRTGAVVIVG